MNKRNKILLPFILSALLAIFSSKATGHDNFFHKRYLSTEEGLSHNEVTAIVQDHQGFIWIGTRGGLNRYDGYEFKIFNQEPGNKNSLVNPSIESLFADSKGNIWIGTKSGGVSKYNQAQDKFTNFTFNYKEKNPVLSGSRIISFLEDHKGQIWMGTWENGLIIFNPETNSSTFHLPDRMINSITNSADGRIWVATNTGLYEYLEASDTFVERKLADNNGFCEKMQYDVSQNCLWISKGNSKPGLIRFDIDTYQSEGYQMNQTNSNDQIIHNYYTISLDHRNSIWMGTWGTGLFVFDRKSEKFRKENIYHEDMHGLNRDHETILDIFQDSDHNMWIGTNGGGIVLLTPRLGFNTIGFHPDPDKGLINTRIRSLIEDNNNNLWLGTIGSGLIRSSDKKSFENIKYPKQVDKQSFFVIKYLYEDTTGNIWAGTNKGIFVVRNQNGTYTLEYASEVFNKTSFGQIHQFESMYFTDQMLWIGTLEDGLYFLNPSQNYRISKRLTKENPHSGDLHSNRISYIFQDQRNIVWVGTYNGLHVYNPSDTTLHLFENYYQVEGHLSGNIITSISQDLSSNIWVGTPNGLNRLKPTLRDEFEVTVFTEKNGLSSNFIKGISHDSQGNIWISTSVGISKYDIATQTFINYNETDGILGRNFTEAAVFRNDDDLLFFGGTNGVTYFNPSEIEEIQTAKKPIITGLKIHNQNVGIGQKFGSRPILEQMITFTDKIVIPYKFNNFEIQFSSLDYKSSNENKYAYKLVNHDKDWNTIGKQRFVNFNNLKHGKYKLLIKSANSQNMWNETTAELTIIILPPFYLSWYAIIFYVLLALAILFFIRWNTRRHFLLVNSLEKEKMQHEHERQINELKYQFFTNISHEFRTPISLILAPLKELQRKALSYPLPDDVRYKLNIVQRNAGMLMKLVNQLLDFRKAETGKIKLFAHYSDIVQFVENICLPFTEVANINHIKFQVRHNIKNKYIWFDKEKMEIIINNLVSNAIKFTRENGFVEVCITESEEHVFINITDNGIGIQPEELNHIFDRFYHIGNPGQYGSSGIGLDLTKRFVELHKGKITVSSKPDVKTAFVVSLPKGQQHLTHNEMATKDDLHPAMIENQAYDVSGKENSKSLNRKKHTKSDKIILIVDDNLELVKYLEDFLGSYYNTKTAVDGYEGYRKALQTKPDLIISDVMMPKTDGYEFCEKIKSDKELSTTPFILLTARNTEKHKIIGAKTGADDYIGKPFDPEYLLQKIENLLLAKEKMKKVFSETIRLEPNDVEILPYNKILLEKALEVIEKNINNPDFSSEMLAQQLHMSKSTLYRKLKEVTNCSVAEFIRSIKVKRAAQLLADKQKTIAEIAYEAGFNDMKHFRVVFQKHFKCLPNEYRERIVSN